MGDRSPSPILGTTGDDLSSWQKGTTSAGQLWRIDPITRQQTILRNDGAALDGTTGIGVTLTGGAADRGYVLADIERFDEARRLAEETLALNRKLARQNGIVNTFDVTLRDRAGDRKRRPRRVVRERSPRTH